MLGCTSSKCCSYFVAFGNSGLLSGEGGSYNSSSLGPSILAKCPAFCEAACTCLACWVDSEGTVFSQGPLHFAIAASVSP